MFNSKFLILAFAILSLFSTPYDSRGMDQFSFLSNLDTPKEVDEALLELGKGKTEKVSFNELLYLNYKAFNSFNPSAFRNFNNWYHSHFLFSKSHFLFSLENKNEFKGYFPEIKIYKGDSLANYIICKNSPRFKNTNLNRLSAYHLAA